MNINNDYQKLRWQITFFPTGEIIEPKRKYLESNSFIHYQIFKGNPWKDTEKWI